MFCSASKDQPIRVRTSKKGVVHGAAYQNYGGFTRYRGAERMGEKDAGEYVPKQQRLTLACRWKKPKGLEEFIVPNTEQITCKQCMKRMGMIEGPIAPKRFVVRRLDTGEFMKNTNSRCSGWAESLTDAFFFRREHTAKMKCSEYHFRVDDELIGYSELRKRGLHTKDYKMEYTHNSNYEIRPVKITLEKRELCK
jgi:hypothetical protein